MRTNIRSIAESSFGLTEAGMMTGSTPAARRAACNAQRMVHAATLLGEAWGGNPYAKLTVEEALTTSDLFRTATGDVLDRELLAQYDDIETQWTKFAARTTVKDFKPKRLVDLRGNRHGLPRVPEHSNYPEASTDVDEKTIQVAKFGEQYGYSFEARINDDLGELQQVPQGWATQARYTEDDAALEVLANPTTGAPNTDFFNVGNDNLGTGELTAENLQEAITAVSTRREGTGGRLLRPGRLQLVVGPALAFTAQRIMNAAEIRTTVGGVETMESNPFRGVIDLTVLATLPGTAWFVIPVPSAPRPAFYVAFLRGWETPDLRYKADQGQRIGGGAIPAEAGSFDDDTIYFRVRHIVGAAQGDPQFTFASDGIAEV